MIYKILTCKFQLDKDNIIMAGGYLTQCILWTMTEPDKAGRVPDPNYIFFFYKIDLAFRMWVSGRQVGSSWLKFFNIPS